MVVENYPAKETLGYQQLSFGCGFVGCNGGHKAREVRTSASSWYKYKIGLNLYTLPHNHFCIVSIAIEAKQQL